MTSLSLAFIYITQGITLKALRSQFGFTLIEMMITVSIIGILSAIALPAYSDHIKKARRADAQQILLQNAALLERQYSRQGQYPAAFNVTALEFYGFTYNKVSDSAFTLTAVPTGVQTADSCGSMTINHQGVKTAAIASCWK
ncbi:type IV pilin protein [Pseudoalteromonas tunicata]|jgi:type IV pilus assembly protein PilE|uniref:Type IV pilin, putative n=1 Tax=Pseudoalteromonas tunicata D2 TaxID=87626 RepID=A4C8P3_9GAMM|nr:type IV pilin protein [Pseudoalteromonas tunicata]EAR28958.1 type IV pilin, putative [Pseudoalteromonas tunicata D2]